MQHTELHNPPPFCKSNKKAPPRRLTKIATTVPHAAVTTTTRPRVDAMGFADPGRPHSRKAPRRTLAPAAGQRLPASKRNRCAGGQGHKETRCPLLRHPARQGARGPTAAPRRRREELPDRCGSPERVPGRNSRGALFSAPGTARQEAVRAARSPARHSSCWLTRLAQPFVFANAE